MGALFSPITSKIFGGLSLGLAIFCGIMWLSNKSLSSKVDNLRQWQSSLVGAVREASGNDKVTAKNAVDQVTEMGTSLSKLDGAIKLQNTAMAEMAQKRAEAEALAEAERIKRQDAIAKADDLAKQLRLGALTPVAPADVDNEVRRVQDLAYEAGL